MKLTIPLSDGSTWETEASAVIGDIAIHPARKGRLKWSATHIPTLKTLNDLVADDDRSSKTRLVKWAGKVQEGTIMVDWIELQRPNASTEAKERIRKHCLTIFNGK